MTHNLPTGLPRKLDLHVPPPSGAGAAGYDELLALLEELGRHLDSNSIDEIDLRGWERTVISHLYGREVDLLMRVPRDAEFDTTKAPEQRWKNLRSILLERKGISRRAVEADLDWD
ncbi:hypothetical protein [Chelativorans sp. YIM 93263]|uniref:hypothetical protein n=1 Tax=Chelativorans sp. YIM 93263 TaxID=2906648 RepID=UPI002377D48C|nr:hypothetical protein [Chelativorans sp. YIM 93263]